ncbi:MAG TPA: hypothetical protein PLE74_08295 [Candidatus Cloacimonadota bacterium]|nr:hypothetical protein [Candidatus Cloacimonadota bacterium]
MGSICEILNDLGYGTKTETEARSVNEETTSTKSRKKTNLNIPKSTSSSGICTGCELSARYF